MGRKSRNKIKKYQNIDPESEDEDIDQDPALIRQKMNEYYNDCLWKIRREMIEYCDNNGLPLCDYLTHDSIECFVDFLKNE